MENRLRVQAAVAGSGEYWSAVSDWSRPALSTRDVAQMLGMEEGAVRQQAFRAERGSSSGFPLPVRSGRAKRWSANQVYGYIRAKKPKLLPGVPALVLDTTTGDLAASVFVAAETWQGPATAGLNGGARFTLVIQYWKPGDGRDSQVALAYPTSSTPMSRSDAAAVAMILAERLFCDDDPDSIQAVAVVTDELRPLADDVHRHHPAMIVIERGDRLYPPAFAPSITVTRAASHAAHPDSHTTIAEIGWFDVASLLRTDLPWWPPVLRNAVSMAAWHPGLNESPTCRPSTSGYSPKLITALVNSVAGDRNELAFRELAQRMQNSIEHQLYPEGAGGYQLPGGLDQPIAGITQAAFPAFSTDAKCAWPPLSAVEMTWLLNQPAAGIIDMVDVLAFVPAVSTLASAVEVTFSSPRGALAEEWASRLREADHMKLGHAFVWKHSRMGKAEDGWAKPSLSTFVPLSDPLDPASWALLDENGDIYYAVATRASAAAGELMELEVNATRGFGGATFFRDSQHIVWPAPLGSHSPLKKEMLATIVRALRADAQCDTANIPLPKQPSLRLDNVFGGLPPWRVTAEDLDAAFKPAARPPA